MDWIITESSDLQKNLLIFESFFIILQHQEEPTDGWDAWTTAVTVRVLLKNVVYTTHSRALGIKYIQ